MLLALPLALLAGLVSFFSPCCLPLVPGYLSYVTGLTGAELAGRTDSAGQPVRDAQREDLPGEVLTEQPRFVRTRVLAGSLLFVAGFSAVFVSYGLLFGALGELLFRYQGLLSRVLGAVVILMGLSFLGVVPGLQRQWRSRRTPEVGLWGAPVLGVVFGLGWTPCIGPTLAAVQTLAFTEASAARGALLSATYSIGLGVPFVVLGLLYRRTLGTVGWLRLHNQVVMRAGGAMLVMIGLLLITGTWDTLTISLRSWASGFAVWL
ncbi:MAG: cytochrome c biogenesis protein CcdA [Actinobacteria bacterium]|nr:cytochrome c biogenesis protein CcdA [Actinomycetota bacterium]